MKSAYGKYKNIRDGAWQCLCDNNISSLPVDVLKIARESDIKVIKNSNIHALRKGEIGLSFFDGKDWFIVYDDSDSIERARFTIAHEMGHIFLGHCLDYANERTARRVTFEGRQESEKEADMFAARLLCPACVLWGLNVHTPEEIAKYCKVSARASKARASRMNVLYKRGKFLQSPLEREVFTRFKGYIDSMLDKK